MDGPNGDIMMMFNNTEIVVPSNKNLEKIIQDFLDTNMLIGERFEGTPERVARLWKTFLEGGKSGSVRTKKFSYKTFKSDYKGIVTLNNYVAYGYCPHHLVPVKYTFKIAYIPDGKIVGLSKLARLADYHLTNLPLQEDLTTDIIIDLEEMLNPLGCAVSVTGYHLCYVMRGVKGREADFKTSAFKGTMRESEKRGEFLNL